MAERAPVTVLTGFLGAGKTTLLNHLLHQPALAGTAVLINEFGEIGIDHLLVEKLDEDTVLLSSGCLCCSVRGDLVRALRGLRERVERGEVRRVAIETTGLADPAPILQTLMGEPEIANTYAMDGVVTVVDCVNADAALDTQPEAVRQVAMADRLVLAKTDLAPPAALAGLIVRLSKLNPAAPVLVAQHGKVDPVALLGCGLFDPSGKIADVAGWLGAAAFEDHDDADDDHDDDAGHDGHAHHHHDVNRHGDRIATFCLTWDKPLHWDGVGMCLQMLISTRGASLLRVKGLLNIAGQARPVVIHGVQHVFHEPVLLDAWPVGDDRRSRLVFITRDLDRDTVAQALAAFEQAADEAG